MIRQVMPWLATGPGDLTIMHAPGRRLTKLVTEAGVVGYDRVSAFEPGAFRIETVEDLAALLEDLAGQTDACIIRGVLKPEFAGQRLVLRRSRDHPGVAARFAEAPRSWLMVDLEHVACPPGIDPTDPTLVGGVLRRFRRAAPTGAGA